MHAAHTAEIVSAEAEASVTCTLKDGDVIKLWVLDLLANLVARHKVAITQAVPVLMEVLQGLVVTSSALGGEERHLQLVSPIAQSSSSGEKITLRALAARLSWPLSAQRALQVVRTHSMWRCRRKQGPCSASPIAAFQSTSPAPAQAPRG